MKLAAMLVIIALLVPTFVVLVHGENVHKLNVVSTLQMFSYFVKRIGGSYVNSNYIVPQGTDIHDYSLTPADIDKISSASLIVLASSEYFSVDRDIKKNAGTKEVLDLNDYNATLLPLGTMAHNFHGYWLYPKNVAGIAKAIYHKLSALMPTQKPYFKSRYLGFLEQINDTMRTVSSLVEQSGESGKGALLAVPGLYYVVKALNMSVKGVLVEGPNQFASQSELDNMRKEIKEDKISVIVNAKNMASSRAGSIAVELSKETGVKVAYIDIFSSDNYSSLMLESASVLSAVSSIEVYSVQSCDYYPYWYVISALIIIMVFVSYLASSYRKELLK